MIKQLHTLVVQQLINDEGNRKFPYVDTVGKTSIGIGRNLTDIGLSDDEIQYLFNNDLARAEAQARAAVGDAVFDSSSVARQAVLINMAFNLGGKLLQFRNMLQAINEKRYADAKQEMLRSKWAAQVGERATRLATMMEHG